MSNTTKRNLHCYQIDGRIFAKQSDLIEYLGSHGKKVNSKIFRALQRKEYFVEIDNKFVRILTREQATELTLLTNQINNN